MITRVRFLLASLLLGSAILARAENAPVRHAPPRPPSPILTAIDTDRDGRLSATEIAAAPTVLAGLDLNDDGITSADEWRTAAVSVGRHVAPR